MHAEDLGEDRGGVGHLVVLAFPHDFAGVLVQTDERLACAAAGEQQNIAVDERRGGVVPLDLHPGVFLHHVVAPDFVTAGGIEAEHAEHGVDDVHFAAVDHGRAAGTVATFVVRRARVAATVVFGDDRQRLAPELLAGLFVEADEHLASVAVRFTGDERVGLFASDREGAETEIRG